MPSSSIQLPLKDKLAIVTGANRGIGLAIIRKLASQGCNLITLTREIDESFIEETKNLSRNFEITVDTQKFDLTKNDTIVHLIKYLTSQKLKIDILVNNAGAPSGSLIHMTGASNLREIFEANFFGPFLLTQSVSKLMVRTGGGSIVNISSVTAYRAQSGMVAYGSSKSAFSYACEVLAMELADKKIRVNTIAPGLIDTDMLNSMEEKAKSNMLSRVPMGRFGEASEVADLVSFLVGNESSYISGSIINVDGSMR